MKCPDCRKPLKKVKDDNVKFINAVYQGVCTNKKCKSKGLFVATGEFKGGVTKAIKT